MINPRSLTWSGDDAAVESMRAFAKAQKLAPWLERESHVFELLVRNRA